MITKSVFTLRHSEPKRTKKLPEALENASHQVATGPSTKKNTVKLMTFKVFELYETPQIRLIFQ